MAHKVVNRKPPRSAEVVPERRSAFETQRVSQVSLDENFMSQPSSPYTETVGGQELLKGKMKEIIRLRPLESTLEGSKSGLDLDVLQETREDRPQRVSNHGSQKGDGTSNSAYNDFA